MSSSFKKENEELQILKNKYNEVIKSSNENSKKLQYLDAMLQQKEEIVEDLIKTSDKLESKYIEASNLVNEVRTLFHKLCVQDAEFRKEPRINVKRLTEMFDAPAPNIFLNMDTVVSRIVETDEYFRNCSSNEDFVERCKHLCNTSNNLSKLIEETTPKKQILKDGKNVDEFYGYECHKSPGLVPDDYTKLVQEFLRLDRQKQEILGKIESRKHDRITILEQYKRNRSEIPGPIKVKLSMFESENNTGTSMNEYASAQTEAVLSPVN